MSTHIPLEDRPIVTPTIPGVPLDDTMTMVIVRPNPDCDGYGEGYHRVPMRVADVIAWKDGRLDSDMLIRRAIMEEVAGFSGGDASECQLITARAFRDAHWSLMDAWSRSYWMRECYYSWFEAR